MEYIGLALTLVASGVPPTRFSGLGGGPSPGLSKCQLRAVCLWSGEGWPLLLWLVVLRQPGSLDWVEGPSPGATCVGKCYGNYKVHVHVHDCFQDMYAPLPSWSVGAALSWYNKSRVAYWHG